MLKSKSETIYKKITKIVAKQIIVVPMLVKKK